MCFGRKTLHGLGVEEFGGARPEDTVRTGLVIENLNFQQPTILAFRRHVYQHSRRDIFISGGDNASHFVSSE